MQLCFRLRLARKVLRHPLRSLSLHAPLAQLVVPRWLGHARSRLCLCGRGAREGRGGGGGQHSPARAALLFAPQAVFQLAKALRARQLCTLLRHAGAVAQRCLALLLILLLLLLFQLHLLLLQLQLLAKQELLL
ncbi:MAG: hypothetical protein ACK4F6_19420, partial [Hylemonella sp.]